MMLVNDAVNRGQGATVDSPVLVSIVIPAYNAARFIERTLHSAVAQSHRPLEIIIVDDGSTDETPEIGRRFEEAHDCIRYVRKEQGGVAEARNHGYALSSGAFVAFLDADDLWHPFKIARQVEAMRSGPNAPYAACFALHRQIDIDEAVLRTGHPWQRIEFDFPRFAVERPVGNGSSIMVSRAAFEEVGGYDRSYMDADAGGCEDLDIELKVVARHPIRCVPEFLVGYRVYDGSMATNHARMTRSMALILERHFRYSPVLVGAMRRQAFGNAYCYMMDKMFVNRSLLPTIGYFAQAVVRRPSLAMRYLLKLWPTAVLRHFRTMGRPGGMAASGAPSYLSLDPKLIECPSARAYNPSPQPAYHQAEGAGL